MNTSQLETWQGVFGDAYTDRNTVAWQSRRTAFQAMLDGLQLQRIVEIGSNRGHNLAALQTIFPDTELFGIEPNCHARATACRETRGIYVLPGNASDLPFKDDFCDLSFTAGVLIHIPLENLDAVMNEVCRISRRYILAAEYYAPAETPVPYRGSCDLLWKRDFPAHFSTRANIRMLRCGFWGPEDGFDNCHWWLFEKCRTP